MILEQEILDRRYRVIFENTYMTTKEKLDTDEKYTVSSLESLLACLYSNEGNDLLGRGEIYDISVRAQIAACEVLLEEYKHKEKQVG